jgi:hypothetical protein
MHGFPQYCISIALSQRGVITQAVIYDPVRNDLFTATKGAGAYLNEKRIRVTKLDRIANALLATGYVTGNAKALDEYLKMYGIMAERSHGMRRAGSAALDLAYVACGRLDGFYEKGLKPWDIAGRRADGDGSRRHRRRVQRRIGLPVQGRHHCRQPENLRPDGRPADPVPRTPAAPAANKLAGRPALPCSFQAEWRVCYKAFALFLFPH